MANNKTTKQHSVQLELLSLYDDYAELDACYAFFCDAVAALSSDRDEGLDSASAEGLRFFSQWLKQRSTDFKGELNATWLHASSQERH